jgi:hypothetical protein
MDATGAQPLLGKHEPVALVADEVLVRHAHVPVVDLGVVAVAAELTSGSAIVGTSRTMSTPGVSRER